jgi:hypothetical protein
MSEGKRVDEDWKKRAQQEKELDQAKIGGGPAAPAGAKAAPKEGPPNQQFLGLVESLASQALMFMGAMRDPITGEAHQDLGQAQAMIEMLQMLEEKTSGNLTKQEAEAFKQILNEVRMHYVRLSSPPPAGPKGPMMGNRPRP